MNYLLYLELSRDKYKIGENWTKRLKKTKKPLLVISLTKQRNNAVKEESKKSFKALLILDKIAQNAANTSPHKHDEQDRVNYQIYCI